MKIKTVKNPISVNLRKARIRKNLSQYKLCQNLGVREETISRWENGVGGFPKSLELFRNFCKITGSDANAILGLKDV